MWGTLATGTMSYVKNSIGYTLINTNNLHNFMLCILESLDDEQKRKYIEKMKIHLGLTVTTQFKEYIFRKVPASDLLKLF